MGDFDTETALVAEGGGACETGTPTDVSSGDNGAGDVISGTVPDTKVVGRVGEGSEAGTMPVNRGNVPGKAEITLGDPMAANPVVAAPGDGMDAATGVVGPARLIGTIVGPAVGLVAR